MAVKESMTEFVTKYALSFRVWEPGFSRLAGLYYKWK